MDDLTDVALQPLTDEAIEAMSPMVKALVAKRLEAMFQECKENLADAEPGRGDARWMELMVRIADRQARIFRFDRVAVVSPDDGSDEDAARVVRAGIEARVSASLDELEARSRAD